MAKGSSDTKLNPNSSKDYVFSANLMDEKIYPKFVEGISFDKFRHIESLNVAFRTPVSIIAGSNKSGKTTVLLAIACSHFQFNKRNFTNGKVERHTWSHVLKHSPHDIQAQDWTYHVAVKTGAKRETRRGQRKALTNKWNGVGKKESQIKGTQATYIDLDRVLPARYFSKALLIKSTSTTGGTTVSTKNQKIIEDCLSYVFERSYTLKRVASHGSEELLGFVSDDRKYSSYNSASGEDVLSRIIIDCIEAPPNSLVLIDEIEIGLHPAVQRRLMDVIFHISKNDMKQFIITTHSATILSCVPENARIFIDQKNGGHDSVSPVSLNAALSKMDALNYPLLDVFCEDDVAERIIKKALRKLNEMNIPGIDSSLVNIVVSGSAEHTYQNFEVRKRTYKSVRIKSGHCCVLDGDMRAQTDKGGGMRFPAQDGLHFLPGNFPPEKVLCDIYEKANKNAKLRYHVDESNVHCLLEKMVESCDFTSKEEAFEAAWICFMADAARSSEFDALVAFLLGECRRFSPDL
ncbi:AAA family ATPase [Cupriavidus consociatus]|uniref:AAA family ATPase n=1 Tax=Cupriavidus consociatus TaxID=2821357 RepID=UPI001AEB4106|nr:MULTISPECIES: AAA family ATPase [unclassified Cupriavidus]MBP0624020.1 AAA family ATPase [Cupriavidus sp. LEh25]MDK2660730.1 AAA family ATPase [Cupriavidus sp. LEh21]